MTRTSDPNTLLQFVIRNSSVGGTGVQTASEQFQGIYDATIFSVNNSDQTCMVIVPAYDGQTPLGPSPYFGGEPTVGSNCVVGFVSPVIGGQGEITVRVLADDGVGGGGTTETLSPFLLMGA